MWGCGLESCSLVTSNPPALDVIQPVTCFKGFDKAVTLHFACWNELGKSNRVNEESRPIWGNIYGAGVELAIESEFVTEDKAFT
jgi:hypothetical protein